MTPDHVFLLVNALPMPIWLTWFVAPRTKLARYFAVLVLGACGHDPMRDRPEATLGAVAAFVRRAQAA